MKLSYTTLSVQERTLKEAIAVAVSAGLDGIELRGRGEAHLSPESSASYRAEALRMLRDSGLAVPCLTAYTRFMQKDAASALAEAESLRAYFDLAETIGARNIRTFLGAAPDGASRETALAAAAEGLNRAAEYIGGRDIRLLIETHDSAKSGAALAPLLATVDRRVGVLLDIIHPFDEGEPIARTLETVGDRIFHVHIKDIHKTVPGGRRYSPIGQGVLPVRETVRALRRFGYGGFYSLEWEKSAPGTDGVSFEAQLESFTAFFRGFDMISTRRNDHAHTV